MQNLNLTSLQNPRVKHIVRLRDRRERDKTNKFLIEGYRELLRAHETGKKIEELYICTELFLGTNEQQLIDSIATNRAQVFTCSEKVFRRISYRDRPDGLIAIAPQQHLTLKELNTPSFLVVAESIEKPGNLGTILRSCDAAGVDAVIVCDPTTDIHNPNVVRASIGTLFTVPVIEASGEEMIDWLKKHNISIVAATPHAQSEFTQTDMKGPVAIVVGTEQYGLSELWMKNADIQVRIPMHGVADSLNVASATTLLLYEVLRQRHD